LAYFSFSTSVLMACGGMPAAGAGAAAGERSGVVGSVMV
jgi:hypothetical protein